MKLIRRELTRADKRNGVIRSFNIKYTFLERVRENRLVPDLNHKAWKTYTKTIKGE